MFGNHKKVSFSRNFFTNSYTLFVLLIGVIFKHCVFTVSGLFVKAFIIFATLFSKCLNYTFVCSLVPPILPEFSRQLQDTSKDVVEEYVRNIKVEGWSRTTKSSFSSWETCAVSGTLSEELSKSPRTASQTRVVGKSSKSSKTCWSFSPLQFEGFAREKESCWRGESSGTKREVVVFRLNWTRICCYSMPSAAMHSITSICTHYSRFTAIALFKNEQRSNPSSSLLLPLIHFFFSVR